MLLSEIRWINTRENFITVKISLCKFINQILYFIFYLISIILNKPRVTVAYLVFFEDKIFILS